MNKLSQQEFQFKEIHNINIFQQCIGINAIYIDQQGGYFYAIGEYHNLKIYDLRKRCTKLIIFCRCECILGLRICEDISTIITCWEPGLLIIHKIETRNWKILKRQYIESSIHFTGISNINQQQNHFACSKSDGSLTIYHSYKGIFKQFQQIYEANKKVWLNIIFIESSLFFSYSGANYLEYFKLNQNMNRYEFIKKIVNKIPIYSIFGSYDRILILGSNRKYIQYILDQEEDGLKQLGKSKEQGCVLSRIQFMDEGNLFVELGFSKQIKLWKLDNQELKIIQQIEFQSRISTASVQKNKNTLIVGFLDGTIKIFV
ncbi:unnamed protein product [Paramecium primaurelia]|uniref:WD40-repeat-containing domain n=1 Tax=Paramecium primaurelia TaxID=5886 RepID=A0A8S1K0M6_PARPR|nr:unnamed protein product [Paramecium primaurelia]